MKRATSHRYFVELMREGKLVYSHGVLFRLWSRKSGWLPCPAAIGGMAKTPYIKISARIDRKIIAANVHAVVWAYFRGEFDSDVELDLNHIDGKKHNNRLENLELITKAGNVQHAYSLGLIKVTYGEDHSTTKLTTEQVREIQAMDRNAPLYPMAKKFGVHKATICLIRARKSRASEALDFRPVDA